MKEGKGRMSEIVNFFSGLDLKIVLDIVKAIIIIIIFKVFSPLFTLIVLKMFNIKKKKDEIKETEYYKALEKFFPILGVYLAIMALEVSPELFAIITKIFKIIVILLIANGFSTFVETNRKIVKEIKEKSRYAENKKIENFIIKILKTIIYAIAIFIIIKELGYDLSGLIAGLGLRKCSNCTSRTGFG